MTSFHRSIAVLTILAGLLSSTSASAHQEHKEKSAAPSASASSGKLLPLTSKDEPWAKKARKTYPLDVCLTSDEKLGSMGESSQFIYREPGKPDRLVVFCCEGCGDDFMKEPATYLAKLDAAAKKKPAAAK